MGFEGVQPYRTVAHAALLWPLHRVVEARSEKCYNTYSIEKKRRSAMSFREPMAHVRYGKIRNWRARHPAWCARCPPERRTGRTARPGGKTIRPGIRACGASLRKSAEPAPPESGTRKKRVECSTRFFRACQEKRFLTRSQKEASGVLSCGAASESSVSEEDVVSSSGRPAVFITNFTLARTPSALPV